MQDAGDNPAALLGFANVSWRAAPSFGHILQEMCASNRDENNNKKVQDPKKYVLCAKRERLEARLGQR